MNIAIFVPSWPPGSSANGIVTYAAQIVPVLRRSGHEVFVLTPHRTSTAGDPYTIDLSTISIKRSIIDRVRSRIFGDSAAIDETAERIDLAIQMLMDRHGLDILEIEDSFGWSLQIARSNRIPVVVRLHGPWFLNGTFDHDATPRSRARIELEGKAIDAATVVTAPSRDVLERVRAHYRLALDDARVVHNPLDVDDGMAAWSLNACQPHRLLYVGRFDRRKGGDLVLRAFADLAARHPDLRLTFVGPDIGIQEANGTQLSFDQFVETRLPSFCRDRIDFKGHLAHRELMSLRASHFLTIVASQFEILPYAVMEAMSLGCPIIATSVGGIPELISDRLNGLLVPSQDVAALVNACETLLDNRTLAAELGKQAHEDCRSLLNSRTVAADTISAYRLAVERFRPEQR